MQPRRGGRSSSRSDQSLRRCFVARTLPLGIVFKLLTQIVCFSAFLPLQRCHQKFQLLRWYKCVENYCPWGFSIFSCAYLVQPNPSFLLQFTPGISTQLELIKFNKTKWFLKILGQHWNCMQAFTLDELSLIFSLSFYNLGLCVNVDLQKQPHQRSYKYISNLFSPKKGRGTKELFIF